MADPLSVTSLVLQLSSVIKLCYDYGKRIQDARQQMISLCGELAALKSILADCHAEYDLGSVECSREDFAAAAKARSTTTGHASDQVSVRGGCDQGNFDEAIKRLKSWFLLAEATRHAVLQTIPEQDLIKALLPHADGMFRWVDSQMNILADQLTPKLVRRALKHLSRDLNATYAGVLSRVPKAEAPFVKDALLWLCFSRRLLTLDELCEAVVLDEGDGTIDDSCRISPNHRLIELCRGLVSWDRPTGLVSLAHSTVRTFLTSEDIRSPTVSAFASNDVTAQRSIVRKCVTNLQFRDVGCGYSELDEMYRLQDTFPLLEYAATHWASHASRAQKHLDEDDLKLIDSFILTHKFEDQSSNFTFWVGLLIFAGRSRKSIVLGAEPLYYLASFGLDVCVERLIQRGWVSRTPKQGHWYIDQKCGRVWSTALHIACARGTIQTVEMLLKAGADPNSNNSNDLWCLHAAAGRRRSDIADLLLQYGAVDGHDEASLPYLQLARWRPDQLPSHVR